MYGIVLAAIPHFRVHTPAMHREMLTDEPLYHLIMPVVLMFCMENMWDLWQDSCGHIRMKPACFRRPVILFTALHGSN